jgi:hypothetical protein
MRYKTYRYETDSHDQASAAYKFFRLLVSENGVNVMGTGFFCTCYNLPFSIKHGKAYRVQLNIFYSNAVPADSNGGVNV